MAIQQRRGAKADFDATKMLPGEFAFTTDGTRKVYAVFAPGDAKELASAEEVEEIIQGGIEEIEQKKEEALAQFPNYEDKLAELEVYKANSIISTSSGTVFHETDCAAVPPINIKLFGKGKQNTVPGNQLFDISKVISGNQVTVSNNSILVTGNNIVTGGYDGALSKLIDLAPTLKIGETYTLKATTTASVKKYIYLSGANTSWVFEESKVITEDILNSIVYWYADEVNGSATISDIIIYQDGDGTWEPYVGGEASPNMKYPQKAEFLGESGSIGGKVLTGNLFDGITKDSIFYWGTDPVYRRIEKYFTVGTYTMCFSNPIYLQKNDLNLKNSVYSQSITFNVTKDGIYYFQFRLEPKIEWDFNTLIWILNGEEALPYEPYSEQPLTALTPNGLRGIPLGTTIQDAIKNSPIHMNGVYWDSVEQKYYIADTKNENGNDVQRIGEYVADGNNDIQAYEYGKGFLITNVLSNVSNFRGALCNQLRVAHDYVEASSSTNMLRLGVNNTHLYLFNNSFYDETLEDKGLANFKAHLNENPLKIWTWLDEPIVTETDARYDVVMNYPNTTIVNDAGAYMEVEYVCDTQEHIKQNYVSKEAYQEHENRIAELEKAIVNS